ncbi:MAG TPA: hypothetical protein VLG11_03300 [Candidatus Saccharimonadales bacterium]|nr:hypothetical protein [Candidatus Saccharimonadales bacterium]
MKQRTKNVLRAGAAVGLCSAILGSEYLVHELGRVDGVQQGIDQGIQICNARLASTPIGHLALRQAETETLAGATGKEDFAAKLNGLNPQFAQALGTAGIKQVLISEVRHTGTKPGETDAANTYNLHLDTEAAAIGTAIHDYQTHENSTDSTAINYDFTRPDLVGDPDVAVDIYVLQLGCNRA